MLREARALEASGIHVTIWPDMLAYWSIWRDFGSTFWPEALDLRAFDAFAPDTSKIVDVMRKIRIGANAHAARLPSGEWLRVERWIEELSPSQDYTKPIYLGSGLDRTRRTALRHRDWECSRWVASARPPFDPEDRQFLYLLWQGSAEWLLRIARTERNRLPQSMEPLEVRLLPVPDTITDAPSDIEVTVAPGIPVVTVILPPAFPERLMTVDNSGEAILVSVLIDALLAARGHQMPDADKSAWLAEIMVHPNLERCCTSLRAGTTDLRGRSCRRSNVFTLFATDGYGRRGAIHARCACKGPRFRS